MKFDPTNSTKLTIVVGKNNSGMEVEGIQTLQHTLSMIGALDKAKGWLKQSAIDASLGGFQTDETQGRSEIKVDRQTAINHFLSCRQIIEEQLDAIAKVEDKENSEFIIDSKLPDKLKGVHIA